MKIKKRKEKKNKGLSDHNSRIINNNRNQRGYNDLSIYLFCYYYYFIFDKRIDRY